MTGNKDITFDKRLIDRSIKQGLFSIKEFEKYLDSLPDMHDKSEPVSLFDSTANETKSKSKSS